ncbi:MAG: hypothetical protein H6R17_1835 [Proteobacteria bacterium]|nr:hypothetical protein [Pseudomonadota bacterium]
MQNRSDMKNCVIPGLTRNPVVRSWIPAPQECFLRGAFAGMTGLFLVFKMTAY